MKIWSKINDMKIWSKLNYVFMWIAMVAGVGGTIIAIYQGSNGSWQFSTAVWSFVAYTNQKSIDRYDKVINKYTEQSIEDMKKIIDKTKN
jgi:hypothetical protein